MLHTAQETTARLIASETELEKEYKRAKEKQAEANNAPNVRPGTAEAEAQANAQRSNTESYKATVAQLTQSPAWDIRAAANQVQNLTADASKANLYGNATVGGYDEDGGWNPQMTGVQRRDLDAKRINRLKKYLQDAGVLKIDPTVELLELAKGVGLIIKPPAMA